MGAASPVVYVSIPPSTVPILDAKNALTLPWRKYFQYLATQANSGGVTQAELAAAVAALTAAIDAVSATAQAALADAEAALAAADIATFGFAGSGLYSSGEQLGQGAWAKQTTWTAGDLNTSIVVAPGYAPTADAVFSITDSALNPLGSITIPAGTLVGSVSWNTDPYVHPSNTTMLIFAPSPADATLSNVTATVGATRSS